MGAAVHGNTSIIADLGSTGETLDRANDDGT